MGGAEIAFLLLVQAAPDPQDAARDLDAAVRLIPGYTADEAPVVGDEPFLLRVYRDLADAVPSAAEVRAFVADADPQKRAALIDRLLEDDRFAESWSKRFSRIYFGDLDQPRFLDFPDKPHGIELRAAQKFKGWLRDKLRKDAPWTEIVARMLAARGTLEEDPALGYLLSFHRGDGATIEFAMGIARDLLGIRLYCARCHDHAFDRWTTDDFHALGAFLARQDVRGAAGGGVVVQYADQGELKDAAGRIAEPRFLLGGKAEAGEDRMNVLARLITYKAGAQLTRALANRVWSWLLGSGIVSPADDFNVKNRPLSPALLAALTRAAIDGNHSVKQLVRVICRTNAYQQALPQDAPGASSFRQLAARVTHGRLTPAAGKPRNMPWPFDPPAAWIRATGKESSSLIYLVRGKADPTLSAEITLHAGVRDKRFVEAHLKQFFLPSRWEEPLEAGSKVTLRGISGLFTCVAGTTDGPAPQATWAAAVEADGQVYTVRFEGDASVVREWRAEFITLLKGAK